MSNAGIEFEFGGHIALLGEVLARALMQLLHYQVQAMNLDELQEGVRRRSWLVLRKGPRSGYRSSIRFCTGERVAPNTVSLMALSSAALSVIGVCVGGLIGVTGTLLPFVFQRNAAKRSSRALTAAYVSGILRMEEIRNRAEQYRRTIESIRSGTPHFAKIFGTENATLVDQDIQREILKQLGLLPPDVARDIIIFNNSLFGLRIDMRAMATGQMDDMSDAEKAEILEADLKLWEDTLALGRSIVARLQ